MPTYNSHNPDRDGARRPRSQQRPQGPRPQGPRRQGERPQGQRPRQARPINVSGPRPSQQPYKSHRNYRTINGTDTGYNLRQHNNVNLSGHRRNGLSGLRRGDRTSMAILIAGIVVLVLLIFGISSCVRGCSNKKASDESTNSLDARVSADANADVTAALTPALDAADGLGKIAANADAYTDIRMIELAVSEPEAIEFVANYPTADKTASSYSDSVAKGTYPQLFDWDSRWGNVDYAGGALGVTGSGPTVVAMAYMGLTGKSDQTPATIATTATDGGYTDEDSGTSTSFFTDGLSSLGLSANEYTVSADNIASILNDGTPLAVLVKADTLTKYPHWVLVVGVGDDDALVVYDPTSAAVSSHTWAASTIAYDGDTMYALSATDTDDASSDADSDSTDTSSSDTTSSND